MWRQSTAWLAQIRAAGSLRSSLASLERQSALVASTLLSEAEERGGPGQPPVQQAVAGCSRHFGGGPPQPSFEVRALTRWRSPFRPAPTLTLQRLRPCSPTTGLSPRAGAASGRPQTATGKAGRTAMGSLMGEALGGRAVTARGTWQPLARRRERAVTATTWQPVPRKAAQREGRGQGAEKEGLKEGEERQERKRSPPHPTPPSYPPSEPREYGRVGEGAVYRGSEAEARGKLDAEEEREYRKMRQEFPEVPNWMLGRTDEEGEAERQINQLPKSQAKFYLERALRRKFDGPVVTPQQDLDEQEERTDEEQAMKDFMADFEMKVIDINRSNKGTRTGGIASFSTMVVIGNSKAVLGLGVGKAAELPASIKKALAQARKTLFAVPRYRGATIQHRIVGRYKKAKVEAWPLPTGYGRKASNMMTSICELAGLHDIGVKLYGSRHPRNSVKAFIHALEQQSLLPDVLDSLPPNTVVQELSYDYRRSARKRLPLPGAPPCWYQSMNAEGRGELTNQNVKELHTRHARS